MVKTMTRQEIFDKVCKHLLKQNKKSMDTYTGDWGEVRRCAYRSSTGLKCAVGVLIPFNKYKKEMEDTSIDIINDKYKLGLGRNMGLLMDLQQLHDARPIHLWLQKLEEVARRYNLKLPKVLQNKLKKKRGEG